MDASGARHHALAPFVAGDSRVHEKPAACFRFAGTRGRRALGGHGPCVVRALDRNGNRVKHEVEGHVARAFLHEIDHLDGVLYIDKLVSPDRVWRVNEDATEDND